MRGTAHVPNVNTRAVKWFLFAVKNKEKIQLTPDPKEFPDGLHWISWNSLIDNAPNHKKNMYERIQDFFGTFLIHQ